MAAHAVSDKVGEDAGEDGDDAVAKGGHGEGAREPVGGEAGLVVLKDHPALKGGEEEACRQAAENAAKEQYTKVRRDLEQARERVQPAAPPREALAAIRVGKAAEQRAKEHGAAEAHDVQRGNVVLLEAVLLVQAVQVRALQPVGRRDEEVHDEIAPLEAGKVVVARGAQRRVLQEQARQRERQRHKHGIG